MDRFKALPADDTDEERMQRQKDFRGKLSAFESLYGFLGQILSFADPDIEKRYPYGRRLWYKPPRRGTGGAIDLGDDVALASYKLQPATEGSLAMQSDTFGELPGPQYTGTRARIVLTPRAR